jgi:23S rRNA pseudouridine955/2504/2580 synthase
VQRKSVTYAGVRFEIGENEKGRRLDRFLKKTFKNASLSFIYRIIRKDVKVNGKRAPVETLLAAGDVIEVFIPEEQLVAVLQKKQTVPSAARKQFKVIFEDENILVVDKPFGLLVHGDKTEKKNTLTNQVLSYLAKAGEYDPGGTGTFIPAPVNRLDRNTTGLVLFGKKLPATKALAIMLKGSEDSNVHVEKTYLTVVKGDLKKNITLQARMVRDYNKNITKILQDETEKGRVMITEIVPLLTGKEYTLIEAKLHTGRTHQIRVQLADAGYPVIGDRKYGDAGVNHRLSEKYGLRAQLLHAYRLRVLSGNGCLEYLKGKTFRADPPVRFAEIAEDLGCYMKKKL